MTSERLAEIEARAEAATQGPWDRANQASATDVIVYGRDNERVARVTRFMSGIGLRNATFIAHARQDIPDLIAEVKRLREILTNPTALRQHVLISKGLLEYLLMEDYQG